MSSFGSAVVDLGFWKGGFCCPERFRLRSCAHTRPATHARKTTKRGGSVEPKEPPGSITEVVYRIWKWANSDLKKKFALKWAWHQRTSELTLWVLWASISFNICSFVYSPSLPQTSILSIHTLAVDSGEHSSQSKAQDSVPVPWISRSMWTVFHARFSPSMPRTFSAGQVVPMTTTFQLLTMTGLSV